MTAGGRRTLTRLLQGGLDRVYPAFQCVISHGGEVVFEAAAGRSCVGKGHVDRDSLFDLASLTKPLAAVCLAMHFHDMGALPLDVPVADLLGHPLAAGIGITPRRLLAHCTGYPGWRPLHLEVPEQRGADRRSAILAAVCATPPLSLPGEKALYSDIDFLLLTHLLEKLGGARLDALFARIVPSQGLLFRPLPGATADRRTSSFVASEDEPNPGRGLLAGRVNDENAFAMGGVSGHAGLFGSASSVHALVNTLLEAWAGHPSWIRGEIVRAFWTRERHPSRTTWALGWDTPSKTGSTAGTRPPGKAVGHTGFTGSSIWVDLERQAIAVLTTNRTWPDRTNDSIRAFRPKFHDAVWSAL